jgi:tRNA-dihydrouridine synthase A
MNTYKELLPQISVAPMLDWTDRHYRYFMRQITKSAILYTEMIVADAIIHGNRSYLLEFNSLEQPLILQIGGSDPKKLAAACKVINAYGYAGINLNVGCPSSRVKSGNFGACLMQDKNLVSDCIKAMQDVSGVPVSIKHRIGLGYIQDYAFLYDFVSSVYEQTSCKEYIIHARNAILEGLSPKQNREIPQLNYDFVYKLKRDLPKLNIILNGGVKTIDEIKHHLGLVDGIMIGREAYYNPFLFANWADNYGSSNLKMDKVAKGNVSSNYAGAITRKQVALNMIEYLVWAKNSGIKLHNVTRHMLGLYHGRRQAKIWRNTLSNKMLQENSVDCYTKLVDVMDDD